MLDPVQPLEYETGLFHYYRGCHPQGMSKFVKMARLPREFAPQSFVAHARIRYVSRQAFLYF